MAAAPPDETSLASRPSQSAGLEVESGARPPDPPNVVYGRLLESAHIAGYTLDRACDEFEWLLDDDRWRTVGGGFEDVTAFLASVRVKDLKWTVERRQRLAKKLAALEASQRATAKALGVHRRTVERDLEEDTGANAPPASEDVASGAASEEDTGANAPPAAKPASMDVHYSSLTPEWSTPQDLFDDLDREFGFDIDVCATAENAKCARYFTAAEDGLAQDWTGVCWMNPPYGDEIAAWVTKAWVSAQNDDATVVCLVPARVDTGWWWDYCRYGEIRFLRGRLRFGGGSTGAPFPSAVVVFGREPRVVWWER